ncbi:SusC/RagA family TonB-linked outer membrane protein [Chitinophaga sp. YR627]|uniref:SusC/RagA family TonB-linked outer membrane protein n=1 Tax=Chitinophaga sp. YR627 TaxID=1881041 RepID=UPI0021018683|nr:SusC/RagA family TonB-linked outer membrane protein [Chitinophaga sp. YR627]
MDVKERVSVELEKVTLDEVLECLLGKKGLEWMYRDGVVSLKMRLMHFKYESLNGQEPTIIVSGRILDAHGEPVLGATVIIKGSKRGTKTDADGRFSLSDVIPNSKLLVSCIGFQNQEFDATGKSMIIKLSEVVSELDATIIKGGYYRITPRFNTGNVFSIKAEEIKNQPVADVLLAMQGRVPGMVISQTTGVQGGEVKVQIRGQNSIKSGTVPLFIVDGVPYSPSITGLPGAGFGAVGNIISTLSFINPADIESIDVLKDADATAIYGSRGANGIVLITTRRGKIGSIKVDINLNRGLQNVGKRRAQLTTKQYLEMRREAFENDGIEPTTQNAPDLLVWDTSRYTDWHKEMIGGIAGYTDAQSTISGGVNGMQYLIGGNYHKETTIYPGDFETQRGGAHFNISGYSPDQNFRATLTGNYSVNGSNFPGGDFASNVNLPPNAPPGYNDDGSLNWANSTWMNPYRQLISNVYELKTNNLLTNIDVSYNVFPGLMVRSNLGYNEMRNSVFRGTTIAGINPAFQGNARASALYADTYIRSWIMEPQISYFKEFGRGTLNFLSGITLQSNRNEATTLNATGISQDALIRNRQAANAFTSNGVGSLYKYMAFFSRIGYTYNDRYLLNITVRRDGSSRFGSRKQFANFGSVGAGWIFSEEEIVHKVFPFLNYGKLRISYGTTGNDGIGDYQYLDRYDFQNQLYQGNKGLQVIGIFNPDFAWEVTKKSEVGLELSIMKNVFTSASYYSNLSNNQLLESPLPAMAGASSILSNQLAKIRNSGLEIIFTSKNINKKNIEWSSSLNVTFSRNKLLSYPSNVPIVAKEGRSLSVKDLYKFVGLDKEKGTYLFESADGKPVSANEGAKADATSVDLAPNFYGGIQNNLKYRSFRLDVFFQYVKQMGYRGEFDPNYVPGVMRNQPEIVLNRWTDKGSTANYQRFNQNYQLQSDFSAYLSSNAAYTKASFIRCKNVSLSWELPTKLRERMKLSGARIYMLGQNLFTVTNYPGWDPETRSTLVIPPLRTITFGIQITL